MPSWVQLHEDVARLFNEYETLDAATQRRLIARIGDHRDDAIRAAFYPLILPDARAGVEFAYLLGKYGWDAPIGDPLASLCGFFAGVPARAVSESVIEFFIVSGREMEFRVEYDRLMRLVKACQEQVERLMAEPISEGTLLN